MDWAYSHTILKMMVNLNRETLVTLGDSRLKPNLEEHEDWEEYIEVVMPEDVEEEVNTQKVMLVFLRLT